MFYKDGKVYSEYELRGVFKEVSFPSGIVDDAFAEQEGFSKVAYGEVPIIDEAIQKVILNEVPTLVNGIYVLEYMVIGKTEDEIREYIKAQIPQTITKLQAMKQMKNIGKWEAFKVVLANDEDINDEWILSDNLNRAYTLVLRVAQLFEFSDEDMDTFFIEASKL